MHIMAAGMHDRIFIPVLGNLRRGGGIVEAGLFRHGQTIHVRAQQDQRTVTIAHHADHARTADSLGHLEPGCLQFHRHALRSFDLEKREFRVGVEVDKQIFEMAVVIRRDRLLHRCRIGDGRRCAGGKSDHRSGDSEQCFAHRILPHSSPWLRRKVSMRGARLQAARLRAARRGARCGACAG